MNTEPAAFAVDPGGSVPLPPPPILVEPPPAFPVMSEVNAQGTYHIPGMTLEEWYAGLAMQGLVAGRGEAPPSAGIVAQKSHEIAREMMNLRSTLKP